ncbi:MAG TPA: insulinase family protein [Spirochaetota bacterium]|nr:insulinase family protein [Spirochaetota bacterium]
MNYETGSSYSGFTLQETREIQEIRSTALIFEHDITGARLLKLVNDDDNKVFSITFRTPPSDDTGLPHILEHSVLTGSRKFPTKEPFVELLKGSLNTFLNAMTFPDKTMYPVASKNGQDFFNLMDVYCDAVFYPNIYQNPGTLMQEGWHYAISDAEEDITYSGVVYNEMKGAFSSPDGMLYPIIQQSLFPENCYRFESGGDPDFIPDLTQEQFLAFHREYYHPANSFIFLYGDGDTAKELAFLHERYLKDFKKIEVNSAIQEQPAFSAPARIEKCFSLPPDDDTADKSYISFNYTAGSAADPELHHAMEILNRILLGTPASPLRQALLESGLCKDVMGVYEGGILQPFFSVVVKHTNEESLDTLHTLVDSVLGKLASEGIDPVLIEASINYIEFQLREAEFARYPKGLYYNFVVMESWLYGAHPLVHLEFAAILEKIRASAPQGYFEGLIKTHLMGNPHSSMVLLKPSKGFGEKKEQAVREKLRAYKSSLDAEALEALINANKKLAEYQSAPDPEEALLKLPMLAISDIRKNPEPILCEVRSVAGMKVLHHPLTTSGITYLTLMFDTSSVPREQLPYVGLLSGLLGKISTSARSYSDLSNEINMHTGGLSFSVQTYSDMKSPDLFYPKLSVKSKILIDKVDRLLPIVSEIITGSDFTGKKRLFEVIKEMKSRYETQFVPQGHIIARKRVLSYFSPPEQYEDAVSGIAFYRFLSDIEKNFDARFDEVCAVLSTIARTIFCRNNILPSVTTEGKGYSRFTEGISSFASQLSESVISPAPFTFTPCPRNEGLTLPQSQVQYVAKAGSYAGGGFSFNGTMHVLSSILRLDYLWNRVRVQGGAYGAFATIQRNGNMTFGSYRDPNIAETLDVFRETGAYLKQFTASAREMTKYVIGTISDLDQHLTPSQKGERGARLHISNISYEDIQRERDEVLGVKEKDIRLFADMAEYITSENYVCVIGSESKIREHSGIFGSIEKLID